jgi:hypothetical protein
VRLLDFADGFESAAAPSVSVSITVTGTWASPVAVTALGGITPAGVAEEIIFIQGSGGPIDITASPQIAAGTSNGQKLTLICTNDTNTVKVDDATGMALNGNFTMKAECVLSLIWVSGLNEWMEAGRVER